MDCLALPATAQPPKSTGSETRVLSFSAGGTDFAIDIRCVREIRTAEPATRMPGGPDALLGVIDLRGTIVPVIDLARHVGAAASTAAATAVIVVEIGARLIGLQVDAVDDVISLTSADLRPVPPLADTPLTEHLLALAAVGDRLLQWLDVSSLLRDVSTPAPASH
jgi:purine-binding chemotaxis protein CheW